VPEGHRANRYSFQFKPTQVLEHLARYSNGLDVILLIDELNSLRKPLDWTGATLLCEEFLDKRGRYLVFSTHSPMNIDVAIDEFLGTITNPSSKRGYLSLSMPFSTDVKVLRTMFNHDLSIVPMPAQVALYGGIPSLLFCSFADMVMTPKMRFELELELNPIAEKDKEPLFIQFAEEILNGTREHALVRRFDIFSSVDETKN